MILTWFSLILEKNLESAASNCDAVHRSDDIFGKVPVSLSMREANVLSGG